VVDIPGSDADRFGMLGQADFHQSVKLAVVAHAIGADIFLSDIREQQLVRPRCASGNRRTPRLPALAPDQQARMEP
jgi:hypothetical protein